MTTAVAIRLPGEASDPYMALRRILNHIAELDGRIKPLAEERAALHARALDIAGNIQKTGLEHETFVLTGVKTTPRRKLDVRKLREKFPEIYRDANPYVDDKTICGILTAARPDRDLQEMARELDPAAFDGAAKIRLPDLDKAAGKRGLQQIEDAGILTTHFYTTGEPNVIQRAIRDAEPRASLRPADDEEEDEDE